MSVQKSFGFSYTVNSIDRSVRATNTLLRAANAFRLSIRDIQRTIRHPNVANIMWTLIQISRTYNALRRLRRLMMGEMNKFISEGRIFKKIPIVEPPPVPPPTGISFLSSFRHFAVVTEANINGNPIPVSGIDLTNLPTDSLTLLQRVLGPPRQCDSSSDNRALSVGARELEAPLLRE